MNSTTIQTFKSQYSFDPADIVALQDGPTGPLHIGILSTQDYDRTYVTTTSGSFNQAFLPSPDNIDTAIDMNMVSGATAIPGDYLLNLTVTDARLNVNAEIIKPLTITSVTLSYDAIPQPILVQTTKAWCSTQTRLMFQDARLNLVAKMYYKKLPMICGIEMSMVAAVDIRMVYSDGHETSGNAWWNHLNITVFEQPSYIGDDVMSRDTKKTSSPYRSPYGIVLSTNAGVDSPTSPATPVGCGTCYFVKRAFESFNREILYAQNGFNASDISGAVGYFPIENTLQLDTLTENLDPDSGVFMGNSRIIDCHGIADSAICSANRGNQSGGAIGPIELSNYVYTSYGVPPKRFSAKWPEIRNNSGWSWYSNWGSRINARLTTSGGDRQSINKIYFTNAYDYWNANYSISLSSPNANFTPCTDTPMTTSINFSNVSSKGVSLPFTEAPSCSPPFSRTNIFKSSDIPANYSNKSFINTNASLYKDISGSKTTYKAKNSTDFSDLGYKFSRPTITLSGEFFTDQIFPTLFSVIPFNKYAIFDYGAFCRSLTSFSTASGIAGRPLTSTQSNYNLTQNANNLINHTTETLVLPPIPAENLKVSLNTTDLSLWPTLIDKSTAGAIISSFKNVLFTVPGIDYIGYGSSSFAATFTYEPLVGTRSQSQSFLPTAGVNIDATYNNSEVTTKVYTPFTITSSINSLIESGSSGYYLNITSSSLNETTNQLTITTPSKDISFNPFGNRKMFASPTPQFNISGYYDWSNVDGATTITGMPGNLHELLGESVGGVTFTSSHSFTSGFSLIGDNDNRILNLSPSIFTGYIDSYLQALNFPGFSLDGVTNTIPEIGAVASGGDNIDVNSATLSIYYNYGDVTKEPYQLQFNGLTEVSPIIIEEQQKQQKTLSLPFSEPILKQLIPLFFSGITADYFSSAYNGYTGTPGVPGDLDTPNMSSLGFLKTSFQGYGIPDWNNSSISISYNYGNSLTRDKKYTSLPLTSGSTLNLTSTQTKTIRYYTKEQREIIMNYNQFLGGPVYIVNVRSNKAGYTFTENEVIYPIYDDVLLPFYKFCKLPRNGIENGDDISQLVDLNTFPMIRSGITFTSYSDEFNDFDTGVMKTLKEITKRLGYIDSGNFIVTQAAQIIKPANKGFLNEFFVLNNVSSQGDTLYSLYLFATCVEAAQPDLLTIIDGLVVNNSGFITATPISTNGFSSENITLNVDDVEASTSIFRYFYDQLKDTDLYGNSSSSYTMRVINNTLDTKYDTSINFGFTNPPSSDIVFYGLLPNTTYLDNFLTYNDGVSGSNHAQIQNFSFTTGVTGVKLTIDNVTCQQIIGNDRGYDLFIKNIRLTFYPENVSVLLSDDSSLYDLVVDTKSDAQVYGDFAFNYTTLQYEAQNRKDENGKAIIPISEVIPLQFYNLTRGRTYSPVIYLQLKSDPRYITNSIYLNQIIIPNRPPTTVSLGAPTTWCQSGVLNNFDLYESTVFRDQSVVAGATGILTIYTSPYDSPTSQTTSPINAQIKLVPGQNTLQIPFIAVNIPQFNLVVSDAPMFFSFSHGVSGMTGTQGESNSYLGGLILTTGAGTTANLNNEKAIELPRSNLINYDYGGIIPETFAGTVSVEPHQFKTVVTIKDFNYYQIDPNYMFSLFYGGTLTVYYYGTSISSGTGNIVGSVDIQPGSGIQDVQIYLDKLGLLQNWNYSMTIVYSCKQFGYSFTGSQTRSLNFKSPSGMPTMLNDITATSLMHKIAFSIPVGSNNYLDTLSFDELQPTLFISVEHLQWDQGRGAYNGPSFPWQKRAWNQWNGVSSLKLDGTTGGFVATRNILSTDGEPKYGFGWREITGNDASGLGFYAPYIPGVGYKFEVDNLMSDSTYLLKFYAQSKNIGLTLIDFPYFLSFKTLPDQVSAKSISGITGTGNYLLDQFIVQGSTSYLTSGNVYFGPTGSSASYVFGGVTSSDSSSYFQFQPQVSINTGIFDLSLPSTFLPGIPSATSVTVFSTTYDSAFIGITGLAYTINGINSVNTNDSLVIIGSGINQVIGLTGLDLNLNLDFRLTNLQEKTTYSGVTGYYQVAGSLEPSVIGIPIPPFTTPRSLDLDLSVKVGITKIKLDIGSGTTLNDVVIPSLFSAGNTGQSLAVSLYSTTTPDETDYGTLSSLLGSTGGFPTSMILTGVDPLVIYDKMKVNYTYVNSNSELQTLNLDLVI